MASFVRFNHSDSTAAIIAKLNTNFANISKAIEDSIRKLRNDIPELPELANVATSGSYSDLTGVPQWSLIKTEDTRGKSVFTPSIIDLSGKTEIAAFSSSATGNGAVYVPMVALLDDDWSSFITSTDKIVKLRKNANPTNLSVDSGCVWNVYVR